MTDLPEFDLQSAHRYFSTIYFNQAKMSEYINKAYQNAEKIIDQDAKSALLDDLSSIGAMA